LTLQARIILLITLLLAVTVLATTAALTWTARESLLAQTEADGMLIARLLARSAEFADRVPRDVEKAIGEQMVVEASIAARLVAVAEASGLSPDQINAHLQAVTDQTVLDEFWITDESGHAYLRSVPEIDFTFSPDPNVQPQAHIFWSLLTGERQTVVQEARQREVDTQVFKYAGVTGIDKPRIVQVGYHASFLEQLRQQMGVERLVQDLVASGNVLAIQITDDRFIIVASGTAPGAETARDAGEIEMAFLEQATRERQATSRLAGDVLQVIAPITDARGKVTGATVVYLSTDHVQATIRRNLAVAVAVTALVLAVGLVLSVILARRVTEPVTDLTNAAAAVEAGTFDLQILACASERRDELGRLARVFQRMAREVHAREQRLRQEVQKLRIEIDETKRTRQVAEITETEYFRQLQEKAQRLRAEYLIEHEAR